MRKAVKQQIVQMFSTLLEAHIEIERNLKLGEKDNVREILADCQDCALTVGDTIEQFEEETECVISELEKYCDILFDVYEQLDTDDNVDSDRIKKRLDTQVKILREYIIEKVRTELKVVFMPYKASMWTSLESVWKAAEADPECEAKVVVIPYCTLDGMQRPDEIIYEAAQFPSEVPITHYTQYDVAKEQPDMIFIHNPYDDTNNVTRIPQEYYSYNLKKYTEKLIYSPYGMMGHYNPKKGSFMCCTNAVKFADKVLVQSEKVKDIYIAHGVEKNKLLALGSPKVDAVVAGLRKPMQYPEEWEKKLKERKVFLVNTHLSYFVAGHVHTLKESNNVDYAKLCHERIFDILLNREGCALIWRPHPLLKQMLKSRGLIESLEFVRDLERRISESENAVLDTNGEYDISFKLSDALITTYSSLIPEYMISGKPVYIYQKRYNEEDSRRSPVCYVNNYYKAQKGEAPTLPGFIDMVLRNEDVLYKERMKDVNRAFTNLEGSIGEKIYTSLKDTWKL